MRFSLNREKARNPKASTKTLGLTLGADRTCWQRKGIKEQNAADHTRSNKLILIGLESHQVDKPHHTDETYRTKHTNRRKVFYRIHTRKSQGIVSHRVGQSQRRHIEGHAECVDPKYHTKITGHSHIGCTKHEESSHEMTEAQQPLCRHPTVGNNTHKSRHKNRHHALYGIKPSYLRSHSDFSQICSHRCQVSSPYCKFKEVQ